MFLTCRFKASEAVSVNQFISVQEQLVANRGTAGGVRLFHFYLQLPRVPTTVFGSTPGAHRMDGRISQSTFSAQFHTGIAVLNHNEHLFFSLQKRLSCRRPIVWEHIVKAVFLVKQTLRRCNWRFVTCSGCWKSFHLKVNRDLFMRQN